MGLDKVFKSCVGYLVAMSRKFTYPKLSQFYYLENGG